MTKVDYEQFRKVNGRANGNCFFGVCAVSQGRNGVVALIAPDVETLEIARNDISTVPLNQEGVQRVAIFSQDV